MSVCPRIWDQSRSENKLTQIVVIFTNNNKKCPKLSLSSRKKISFLKTLMERVTKTFSLQDLPAQRLCSSSFCTESSSWTFLMLPWGTVSDIDNKLNFCCEEVYKVYFLWLSSLASWHTFCIWSLVYFIFLFLNMGTWGRLVVLYLKGLWLANNQKTRLYLFLLKAKLTTFLSPKSGLLLEQCCNFLISRSI